MSFGNVFRINIVYNRNIYRRIDAFGYLVSYHNCTCLYVWECVPHLLRRSCGLRLPVLRDGEWEGGGVCVEVVVGGGGDGTFPLLMIA